MSRLGDTLRRLADDMDNQPDGNGLLLVADREHRTISIIDKEGSAKLQPWFDRIMNMVYDNPDTIIEERKVPVSKRPKRTKIRLKPDLNDWDVDGWVDHLNEVWINEDGLEEAVRKIAGQILEAFFETDCGVFLTEKGILLEHKVAQHTIPYSEVFAEFPQSKIDKLHRVLSDDLVGMPGDVVEETNE